LTSFRNITILIFSLLLAINISGCRTKKANTVEDGISLTSKQLEKDLSAIQDIKNSDYQHLSTLFKKCDSLLILSEKSDIDDYFTTLSYANGYLSQFDDLYPVIVKKIGYSQEQLSNLSSDISSNYINDSLAAIYLDDEIHVADTIHEQIKYFGERFKKMNGELKKIEKELKK